MQSVPVFRPAWWLSHPHLQTIYPSLWRKVVPPVLSRERLITADGDFLDLDWCGTDRERVVILLHGLSGSSRSGYILGLQQSLLADGWSSVALNFRGCSGEPNQRARSYHSGETEDIQFVYQSLRQRYPQAKLAAAGFSLGGNVLLKWLGEQADTLDLLAAVAVSVPLVLSECATRLDNGFSKVYRAHLLGELKQYIQRKQQHLVDLALHEEAEKLRQLGDLSAITSFWQYDDRVVAPLHHYKNVDDYYQRASSRQFLAHIQVPTLLIQAADDPFMTDKVLPHASELSAHVSLEITATGGHVGFISGQQLFKPHYWLDQRIPAFLRQHLGYGDQ